MVYEERKYRSFMEAGELVTFQVMVKETDLWISAESDLSELAHTEVRKCRRLLEQYIHRHPEFLSSLEPIEADHDAPQLIQEMAAAGRTAGVGPMAAVAGVVAEFVGNSLSQVSGEVIVENGGDLFLSSKVKRVVSIFAGTSPFSHRVGIRVQAGKTPLGICTSSGTVGHSKSFGHSDAVTVLASSAALADAAATAAGNLVHSPEDVRKGLDFLAALPGVQGGLIIVREAMGAWGDVELVKL